MTELHLNVYVHGTWNSTRDGSDYSRRTVIHELYDRCDGPKIALEGLGTRYGFLGKMVGGAFGVGRKHRFERLREWVDGHWVVFNNPITREDDLVNDEPRLSSQPKIVLWTHGYSRGAALLVELSRRLEEVFPGLEVEIRFMALVDCVTAFGANALVRYLVFLPKRWRLHWNLTKHAPRPNATVVVHALAAEERDPGFQHTIFDDVKRNYFLTDHHGIGADKTGEVREWIEVSKRLAKWRAGDE